MSPVTTVPMTTKITSPMHPATLNTNPLTAHLESTRSFSNLQTKIRAKTRSTPIDPKLTPQPLLTSLTPWVALVPFESDWNWTVPKSNLKSPRIQIYGFLSESVAGSGPSRLLPKCSQLRTLRLKSIRPQNHLARVRTWIDLSFIFLRYFSFFFCPPKIYLSFVFWFVCSATRLSMCVRFKLIMSGCWFYWLLAVCYSLYSHLNKRRQLNSLERCYSLCSHLNESTFQYWLLCLFLVGVTCIGMTNLYPLIGTLVCLKFESLPELRQRIGN